MSVDLHKELVNLRRNILNMGASVEERVTEALDALFNHDLAEAQTVRVGDDEIDAMDLDIERECLRLLSLTQPVATDLRFILAVMRINTDLERIADMAKSIAKRVIAMEQLPGTFEPPATLREMAKLSRRMLDQSLAALANNDGSLCTNIRKSDDQVDDLLKEMFAWAQETIQDDVEVTAMAINMLSVARKLERIADMATNIAEDVIFIIDGAVVRHTPA